LNFSPLAAGNGRSQHYGEAIEKYKIAAAINPARSAAWKDRASALDSLGRTHEAEKIRALSLDQPSTSP
jgi:Flp pilus assembly protein TadD